ncbi:hypothetical protein QR680_003115 [Steinernema hermaphroditum]|uniref:Uncharacterized protein n=1 Tax=Steinernema hermaphroditum TaxID=289476 RepID=A0AA39LJP8_9BILA|nr:hypothetical protein QR680_003115 [Steinernema hermaphroditum]
MRIDVSNRTEDPVASLCESETQFNTAIYISVTVILTLLTMLIWAAAIIGLRKEKNIALSCFSMESLVELVAAKRRSSNSARRSQTPVGTINSTIYQNLPRAPLRLSFLDKLPEPPKITIDKIKELNMAFNMAPKLLGTLKSNKDSPLSASASTLDVPINNLE